MRDETWVIIDTETTGLSTPIYAVEIAAQRMRGWKSEGEPFCVLLNHNVPIEPMAEALHGYSREYLRQHGADPREAHNRFRDYAGDLPVVAYNVGFDWDRVLYAEYCRLGVPPAGRKGFCAMTLARRTICESQNYKLDTLREQFGLTLQGAHTGDKDVEALCALCERVFAPRLTKARIVGFESVAVFSRQTPVAKCLQQVTGETPVKKSGRRVKTGRRPEPGNDERVYKPQYGRWVDELVGMSRGILADEVVNERELLSLQEWLTSCPCTHLHPINTIADTVEKIVCDGVITAGELEEMKACLESLLPATG